ncbi:MAG: nuclear transport factor 2 family protein [Opitutaceae bacterium]
MKPSLPGAVPAALLRRVLPTRPVLLLWLLVLGAATAWSAAPSRDEVLALIRQQAGSWESGDEAAFLASLHPDSVFAYPGKRLTRDGALVVFREWKRDFTDTRMKLHRVVIDGAQFSIEYTFATTRRSTGRRSAAGTVAVGEVRDGRLVVWKEYLDGRVSRQQAAGELPVDENAEPFPWPDTPESRRP